MGRTWVSGVRSPHLGGLYTSYKAPECVLLRKRLEFAVLPLAEGIEVAAFIIAFSRFRSRGIGAPASVIVQCVSAAKESEVVSSGTAAIPQTVWRRCASSRAPRHVRASVERSA
jgi:hypothetical protein